MDVYTGAEPAFRLWGAKLKKNNLGGQNYKFFKQTGKKLYFFFFFLDFFFFFGGGAPWAPQAILWLRPCVYRKFTMEGVLCMGSRFSGQG